MLHFYEVNFGIRIRQNIGQISSVKPKKRYVSFCHYEGSPLNRKAVITSSTTLSLLNLMLCIFFLEFQENINLL